MTGHWICDACGYDGEHAKYCKYLRPVNVQWKGHRTSKEMEELRSLTKDGPRPTEHKQVTEKPIYRIDHDGFVGVEIGSYTTLEGKEGVVLQQVGTKVVHVYGRKWLIRA